MIENLTVEREIGEFRELPQYIIGKRYSRLQRIQHWGNVFMMIFFFISGFEIYLGNYWILNYTQTRDLHVYMGIVIIFWSVLFYLFIFTKEKKFRDVIPTPRDFMDLITILLCAFRILPDEKYPHYDFYDPVKKKYVMKYHPTQKFLATGNFIMLNIIAITGFALYEELSPGTLGLIGQISLDIINPMMDWIGLDIRFLHFVIFLYFLFGTTVHFYFTMLPQNRSRLKGMVTGNEPMKVDHNNVNDILTLENIPD